MREQEMLSPREKAAKALGAAMLAAIELTVREYMAPGQGEEFPLSAAEEQQTVYRGGSENESFDLARFQRLLQESRSAAQRKEKQENILFSASVAGDGNSGFMQKTEEEIAGSSSVGAEDLSECFERDARRYDGQIRVYE